MNILVIDKSVFRGKISDASYTLLKHLLFWQKHNNDISLLARIEKDITKNLKAKIDLVKFPPRILFLSTYFTYYYLLFKSKKYDLVIEVWGRKPTFRLIYNSKRSLILILGSKFKKFLPNRIFKLIYRKNKFLVNSSVTRDKLCEIGIKESNIRFVPDGIEDKKISNKRSKKKNKILIICEKDVGGAINQISLIERRSLDWKFVVLTQKKYVSKIKDLIEGSNMTSNVKAMVNTDYNFKKNVSNSKYLILINDVKKPAEYALGAFFEKTPVLTEGIKHSMFRKEVRNLVLSYGNKMDVASELNNLSKNADDYKFLKNKISKAIQFNTWDEVGKLSLEYIESL